MKFIWDPRKAESNLRKHGIAFDEAITTFNDPLAFIFDDTKHSEEEHREIIIGTSALSRIVLYALWKKPKTRSVLSLHAAQRRMKSETMKKTPVTKSRKVAEMAKEYRFDYSKAKPNRFASRMKDSPLVAVIDADVSKVFKTAEQVNSALRALISAMPSRGQAK